LTPKPVICAVFDKTHQRRVLSGPSNQLQAFRDSGQYWDAWNIDPKYAHYPNSIEIYSVVRAWLSQTRVRCAAWVNLSFAKITSSKLERRFLKSPLLTGKASGIGESRFPLNLEADYATYEFLRCY